MEEIISRIIKRELNDVVNTIIEIKHGSVNKVFDVYCLKGNYIIRLNIEAEKAIHFQKEKWCYAKVSELGIPSPQVLGIGKEKDYHYMILSKIEGINGSTGNAQQKITIWKQLGQYASTYNQIKKIALPATKQKAFHKDWESKLNYNIEQLTEKDALLEKGVFSTIEHTQIKQYLLSLKPEKFNFGLVHGDLCPRNVILNDSMVYLLDWEMAKIGIIPHTEIGMVLIDETANPQEFEVFLAGMNLSKKAYHKIEKELRIVNLLSRLDLYRWALGRGITHKNNYIGKLQAAFNAAHILSLKAT